MNGVNNVNIPSYERQFQLTSSQSSLIVSINDVGAGLTVSSFQNPTSDKRAMSIIHCTSEVANYPHMFDLGCRGRLLCVFVLVMVWQLGLCAI